MKHKILNIALMFLLPVLLGAGCEKEENELPVEFKFVLLDTLGNEKTEFNQGENIIFSFQVINKSSEDLMLENFFPNKDFFRVYQTNTSEGTLNYGIPYEGVSYIGYFPVPANGQLELKCPWVSSGNTHYYGDWLLIDQELHQTFLPKGSFYTGFSQSFKIGEVQTEEKYFEIKFTVK